MSIKITHEEKFEDGVKIEETYCIDDGCQNYLFLNPKEFKQLKEQMKRYE